MWGMYSGHVRLGSKLPLVRAGSGQLAVKIKAPPPDRKMQLTYRNILAVFPSSSGSAISGAVAGYVTGICGSMQVPT